MSESGDQDDAEKSFDATEQKLRKAREKGEIAKSNDLAVAASYAGLLLAALAVGSSAIGSFGTTMMVLLDQPDRLAPLVFDGPAAVPLGGLMQHTASAVAPWFALPALCVLCAFLAQRAMVFAPSKLEPKLSRISLIANFKNKFGRSGLFEFLKSFVKLLIYSICLYLFLRSRLPEMIGTIGTSAWASILLMARFCVEFLFIAVLIATLIGVVDAIWQHKEHLRKNMMTRKEVTDEAKESEGDPHMKQQRRHRGQEIALSQMMVEVPKSDVVIVNPTHYAVALKWSRTPGTAPVCVAKGVDEIAAAIRRAANEAGVPIHSDPPTARALHASVEIGEEISEGHYAPVAAAIRFAETMRQRAKGKV